MTQDFAADCRRYCGGRPLTLWLAVRLVVDYPGLLATLSYRLGKAASHASGAGLFRPLYFVLHRVLRWYVEAAYDIRIAQEASIGSGLYIGHFGAIDVQRCTIGRHCNIGQSTTIGPNTDNQGPTVGSYTWIGPHSTVVGPYSIGSNVTLAAGSTVARNLPDGALCVGAPARVIMRDYDNSALLGLSADSARLRHES